jgi:hypothetical protein
MSTVALHTAMSDESARKGTTTLYANSKRGLK